jgi:hypothetical protein
MIAGHPYLLEDYCTARFLVKPAKKLDADERSAA